MPEILQNIALASLYGLEENSQALQIMHKRLWHYCGLWPIKYRQLSKTNKSNYQFWKNSTYDWLIDNLSQDLFGQRLQYHRIYQVETVLTKFGTSKCSVFPCLNNSIYLVKFARSPVPIRILVIIEVFDIDRIECFILNSGPLIMEPWNEIGDRGRKQFQFTSFKL